MTDSKFTLVDVTRLTGIDGTLISAWIAREWVSPSAPEIFDQEDIARLGLINELQHDFGANEEAIPLILHLIDQLCHTRELFRQLKHES